jgi:hypothetical protein
MKPSEYQALLSKAWKHGRRVLAVGKPGVGKTYGGQQVCGRDGFDMILQCSPLLNPVKIGGYPRAGGPGEDATHALFDGIGRAMRATQPTVLFWDDLGMATGETLKAIVQLVQFGRIDGRKLPDCVVQAGASNDVTHGAGVDGLIEPLKTRWHTIVNVETDLDDVIAYGLVQGWPACLLGYLRNSPDALHDWVPVKSMSIGGATPRGWEYVAEWINIGVDDREVLAGCVGPGRATAYLSYRELMNDLPDINEVLINPDTAKIPDNPGGKLLVCMALAGKMDGRSFGPCITYLNRLPQMMRAFTIKDAHRAEEMRSANGVLPKGYQKMHMSRDYIAYTNTKDGKEIFQLAVK